MKGKYTGFWQLPEWLYVPCYSASQQIRQLISECFPHTLEILHLPMRITDFRTALCPVYLIQESMSRMIIMRRLLIRLRITEKWPRIKQGVPLMLFRISLWFSQSLILMQMRRNFSQQAKMHARICMRCTRIILLDISKFRLQEPEPRIQSSKC